MDGGHHDQGFMSSMFDSQYGLIRNDRLLTDSLSQESVASSSASSTTSSNFSLSPASGASAFIPPVKTEHSYSMAGSDGDSIPDSPMSNNDGNFNNSPRISS